MSQLMWGLLGPDLAAGSRRIRTLGLGDIVRDFNEKAVPGLGGVWFGKQLLLALLGVALAGRAARRGQRLANIRCANAMEALACYLALHGNHWTGDPRLRGLSKMRNQTDLGFDNMSRPAFYVTQPMRMATVQALPALGLVTSHSARFNAYVIDTPGQDLLDAAFQPYSPCYYSKSITDVLDSWVAGQPLNLLGNSKLAQALSPLLPLPKHAAAVLKNALLQGATQEALADKQRRRAALAWVERLRQEKTLLIDWAQAPAELAPEHWHDLCAGAEFFRLRDLALAVLDELEQIMGNTAQAMFALDGPLPLSLTGSLQRLRGQGQVYLALAHPHPAARGFAQQCAHDDDRQILAALLARDGRVLRLLGRSVLPGAAFIGDLQLASYPLPDSQSPAGDGEQTTQASWAEGISERISNLFLLNADLHGELDLWLGNAPQENETR